MMRRFLLLAALAAGAACGRTGEAPAEVEAPLIRETPVAAKAWDGILVEFGSPAALPLLDEGWSFGETAPDGNAFRWAVGDAASFRFESDAAGRRLGWIECQPHRFPGAPEQALGITLNGNELPTLHLQEGRSRYPLELPLVAGENVMEIRFRYARAPRDVGGDSQDRRRLAVAFYRFDVPPDGVAAVEGKPGPFAIVEPTTGAPGVFLPAGGRLSLFVDVPPRSRLHVQVGASQPERLLAPSGASVRVSVRSKDSLETEDVVESAAARGDVVERDVSLDALAGQRAELSFLAESADVFVSPTLWHAANETAAEQPVPRPEVPDRLNVLVLVLDGASARRMSAYGYSKPTTPAIESMAQESVVFDWAISQAVYTIASVGSLITGQYPERHQSVSFADRLPASAVTLPGILAGEGFFAAGFSGNAVVSTTFGLDGGYQEFQLAREIPGYTGHGDSVESSFLEWLKQHSGDRFFAYVHFREPHFPYDPPPPYDTRFGPAPLFPDGLQDWEEVDAYNRAAARGEKIPEKVLDRIRTLYEGNLAYVDRLVGEILDELDRLGLAERTVVVLTADHGEALFEHGFIGHNTQLYDESVRIPFIWRVPGMAPRHIDDVVQLIDLAPTVLDLVGLGAEPAKDAMQGRSLLPLMLGNRLPPRPAFTRTLWNKPRYSVLDGESKYIWDSRSGASELYDLALDPEEATNVVAQQPFEAGYRRQEIFRWLREQEHLRAGAPPPEEAHVPEDLGDYLGGVGYLHYVEPPAEDAAKKKEDDD